jgi:hypothetical protein
VREGTEAVPATASILHDIEPFGAALRSKYGLMVPLIDAFYKVRNVVTRRPTSERVVIELQLG